jgi:hypothetical protein
MGGNFFASFQKWKSCVLLRYKEEMNVNPRVPTEWWRLGRLSGLPG